jgi:dolichol-phosphate mannosyltransferase
LFVRRLLELRCGRLGLFAAVGASGIAVNSLVLFALTSRLQLWYLPASLLSTEAAILWNFALSERFVFDRERRRLPSRARLARFVLVNTALALIGSPLLFVSVSLLSANVLAANAVCLTLLCLIRFMLADRWIWAPAREHVSNERDPAPITPSVLLRPASSER